MACILAEAVLLSHTQQACMHVYSSGGLGCWSMVDGWMMAVVCRRAIPPPSLGRALHMRMRRPRHCAYSLHALLFVGVQPSSSGPSPRVAQREGAVQDDLS
jgi:hypothetical protein